MERILTRYDKECTMTITMDYREYITLMNCLMNYKEDIYKMDAKMLFEDIEESNFKVIDNTNY